MQPEVQELIEDTEGEQAEQQEREQRREKERERFERKKSENKNKKSDQPEDGKQDAKQPQEPTGENPEPAGEAATTEGTAGKVVQGAEKAAEGAQKVAGAVEQKGIQAALAGARAAAVAAAEGIGALAVNPVTWVVLGIILFIVLLFFLIPISGQIFDRLRGTGGIEQHQPVSPLSTNDQKLITSLAKNADLLSAATTDQLVKNQASKLQQLLGCSETNNATGKEEEKGGLFDVIRTQIADTAKQDEALGKLRELCKSVDDLLITINQVLALDKTAAPETAGAVTIQNNQQGVSDLVVPKRQKVLDLIDQLKEKVKSSFGSKNSQIVALAEEEFKKGAKEPNEDNIVKYPDGTLAPYSLSGSTTDNRRWCASFVSFIYRQVYSQTPNTASAPELANFVQSKNGYAFKPGKDVPKPGDMMFLSDSEGIYHVGIVVEVSTDGQKITTVDGNSGDKVNRKPRSVNDPSLYGRVLD